MIRLFRLFASLLAFFSTVSYGRNCGYDESYSGCKLVTSLSESECFCGISCGRNDFPFSNRAACEAAIDDPCYFSPCQNGGECIKLIDGEKFRCECGKTGFYGDKCQKKCPRRGTETENVYIREITFEVREQQQDIPLDCL